MCSSGRPADTAVAGNPAVEARPASRPWRIDGAPGEGEWMCGRSSSFLPIAGADGRREVLRETGRVMVGWDRTFLYVTAELVDREIIAHGDADGLLHHRLGDVCEVFLKPAHCPWYCEVHVTPKGHHTTFEWVQHSREPSSGLRIQSGVKAAARLTTLRNGWTAGLAIPLAFLERSGERFAPGAPWAILIGRYNYSRDLARLELSSLPALSRADFHRTGEYAPLHIVN